MKTRHQADRSIAHEFVDLMPPNREEGKIYISITYATAVHNCFCGCRTKVVTPISPTGWALTFDGDTVTLYPSIGNWGFRCRSHYWIRRNRIVWAKPMSQREIEIGRTRDQAARAAYFERDPTATPIEHHDSSQRPRTFWDRLIGRH